MEVDCVWRLGPMFQALKEATSWFAIIQAKLSRRWWPPTVRRRAAGNQKEIRGKAIGRRKERREEGKRDPHPPHSSPVWFQPIAVAGRSSRSQCCCCNRFFRFSTVLTGCLTMIPVFFLGFLHSAMVSMNCSCCKDVASTSMRWIPVSWILEVWLEILRFYCVFSLSILSA